MAVLLLMKVCVTGEAQAQSVRVDESFNPPKLSSEISYLVFGQGKVIGLALGPQDEIYIGGHFTLLESTEGWKRWNGLARLQSSGAVDESFAVPIYSNDTFGTHIDAHDIFVTNDRKVWAGFDYFRLRYSTNGSEVPMEIGSAPWAVKIYPDGRRLAHDQMNGRIKRDRPNGTNDDSFTPFPNAVDSGRLVLRNEKILAEDYGFGSVTVLKRYFENGTPDGSFQSPRFGLWEENEPLKRVRILLERANGQLYVAGTFEEVNEKPYPLLVRINEDGTLDESFRPDARLVSGEKNAPQILALALQANGKLLVAGSFSKSEEPLKGNIVRLNLDGSIDETFAVGTGATDGNDEGHAPPGLAPPTISKLAIQSDGKIIATGDFQRFNGLARDGIVRLHGDPVESLRIRSFRKVTADRGEFDISGTADVFDLEEASSLSSNWISVNVVRMTNEISTKVEVAIDSNEAKFFRVKRR